MLGGVALPFFHPSCLLRKGVGSMRLRKTLETAVAVTGKLGKTLTSLSKFLDDVRKAL